MNVTHSYVDVEIVLNICIIVMKENTQNNPPYILPTERERGREGEREKKGEGS